MFGKDLTFWETQKADFFFSIVFGSISRVLTFPEGRRQSEPFMGHPADAHKISEYVNTDMFDMFSDLPKMTIMEFLSHQSCYLFLQQIPQSSFNGKWP